MQFSPYFLHTIVVDANCKTKFGNAENRNLGYQKNFNRGAFGEDVLQNHTNKYNIVNNIAKHFEKSCENQEFFFLRLLSPLFLVKILLTYSGWAFSRLLTYPTMTKHGTVISFLKKIRKVYKSRETPLEFCWYQYCFNGNQ